MLLSHHSYVFASAAHPAAAANGSYGHYGYDDEEWDDGFPPPPSPGSVEEMSRDLPLASLRQRYSLLHSPNNNIHNTHCHNYYRYYILTTHLICTSVL